MKSAILGGSFDPPHNGHLSIAQQIKRKLGFDQIILMPCFQHPFHKFLSKAHDRLAMTKLLETHVITVSDFEITQKKTSYSIDTLAALTQKFPNDSFSWVLGSDQLKDFPKWKDWQTIIEKFGLIIVPREMTIKETKELAEKSLGMQTLPSTISFLDAVEIPPISSTTIRERVKNNEPIDTLVPKPVEEYIIKQKLYIK